MMTSSASTSRSSISTKVSQVVETPLAFCIVCDYGSRGRETVIDWEDCSKERVILDIMRGEHSNPIAVKCINEDEGTYRDVSEDIAREILERIGTSPDFDIDGELIIPAREFIERHLGCGEIEEVESEFASMRPDRREHATARV